MGNSVGKIVGLTFGGPVEAIDGLAVGMMLTGLAVGKDVGNREGPSVEGGSVVGDLEGNVDSFVVGTKEGEADTVEVGVALTSPRSLVTSRDGTGVGAAVSTLLGLCVGSSVGKVLSTGLVVGKAVVGISVVESVGLTVCTVVGSPPVGEIVGLSVCTTVGELVGLPVGKAVGNEGPSVEGLKETVIDGLLLGNPEGPEDGVVDGLAVRNADGA